MRRTMLAAVAGLAALVLTAAPAAAQPFIFFTGDAPGVTFALQQNFPGTPAGAGLTTYTMPFGLTFATPQDGAAVQSLLLQFLSGATETILAPLPAGPFDHGYVYPTVTLATGDSLTAASVTYQLAGDAAPSTLELQRLNINAPEPATLALLGTGLLGLGVVGTRRRRRA